MSPIDDDEIPPAFAKPDDSQNNPKARFAQNFGSGLNIGPNLPVGGLHRPSVKDFLSGGAGVDQGDDQEQVFQMLWDCRFCNTQKLLGLDHRHCPNCGATQDPAWRYFPSPEDIKYVTDADYVYAGVDKICPFCQTPNSAAAKFCKQCGGDLSGAVDAAQQNLADHASVSGVRNDVVKDKFNADLNAAKAKPKRAPIEWLLIALIGIVLCVGAVYALFFQTSAVTLAVTDVAWSRAITVERFVTSRQSDWQDSMRAGAYNVSCSPRQRSYTESEQYQCGSEMRDRGDGSGVQVPKYCSRSVTKYRNDNYCSYSVDSWVFARKLENTGTVDQPLTWPAFTPLQTTGIGAERAGASVETLIVRFRQPPQNGADAQDRSYNPPDVNQWKTFRVGGTYTVQVNRLNMERWETLQESAR